MGGQVSRKDFEWVGSDEPHASRRSLILKKYPQIKQLMTVDTRFKWMVTGMVIVQLVSFYLLRNASVWLLCLIGYCFGGIINHTLMLAIHEIAHNQAFGHSRPLANKIFGMFANIPIGFPFAVAFKKYHLEHHRYQGDDVLDTDIPSRFEAEFFTTTFTKLIWVILQPFFYAFRPLVVHPKQPTTLEVINTAFQLAIDYLIGITLGWHIVAYMALSSLACMGLHPVAGHFISEHYIMFRENQQSVEKATKENHLMGGIHGEDGRLLIPETCSYYGPLNWVTFNVGYHVEHHDFPSIPGTYLPRVKQIAPEFYDSLSYHNSWSKTLWTYITDPTVGPYARVKREHVPLSERHNNHNHSSEHLKGHKKTNGELTSSLTVTKADAKVD